MVLRFELGEGSPPRGGAGGPFCWGAAELEAEDRRPRFSTAPHNPSLRSRRRTCTSARGIPHHRLGLEELLQPLRAPLAAVARLAVAAERRREIDLGTIEVDHARAKTRRDATRVLDGAGEDVARQAVVRVVGD